MTDKQVKTQQNKDPSELSIESDVFTDTTQNDLLNQLQNDFNSLISETSVTTSHSYKEPADAF
ncbi:MAG: hypothetical protein R8K22_00475, partial [Mariprofundaceae bacterium]